MELSFSIEIFSSQHTPFAKTKSRNKMASLTALALSTMLMSSALAQTPPILSKTNFVLYPIITAGNLSGPYTNSYVNKTQPFGTLGIGSK
jgi:hypothetical protein